MDFSDYASQVLHAIVVILDTTSDLRPAAMDALCSLMTQLSQRYKIFIPMVKKVSGVQMIQYIHIMCMYR